MSYKRDFWGGNLMEYVVPVALIGLVVGMGLYSVVKNQTFFKNVIFSSSGSVDVEGGKISFGSGTAVGGVFLDTDGKMYLSNNKGQSVRIPLAFQEKYKEGLQKYLKDGKFDKTGAAVGVETSGSVGIEDIAYATSASTLIYSTLIDLAADGTEDENAKKLLEKMSLYGNKLGELETELGSIKKQIDANFQNFKANVEALQKSKKAYDSAKAAYEKKPTDENRALVEKAEADLQAQIEKYNTAKDSYKDVSAQYLDEAKAYFDNLKKTTGLSFDQVLDEISKSDVIDPETKEFVVPVGQKIKAVKDSVDLIEKLVSAFNANFDAMSSAYSQFADSFTSFDIIIDEKAGDKTFDMLDNQYLAKKGKGKGKGKKGK